MKEFIKDLVNYVIEAKYQPDQDAETHRLYRINRETSPSQAPAKRAETFRKINADYKEEKRLERAPRGPQTRPVVGKAKPVEEGVSSIAQQTSPIAKRETTKYGKTEKTPEKHTGNRGGSKFKGAASAVSAATSRIAKAVAEGAEVPKGTVTGPARKPTIAPAAKKQTQAPSSATVLPVGNRAGNVFSKTDWKARKAAMDKAIDG